MKTVNGLRYVAARWLAIVAARARAGESLTWAERQYAAELIPSLRREFPDDIDIDLLQAQIAIAKAPDAGGARAAAGGR